ncbi:MAG: transporter substrate-binding domain-containing protein, partial [Rhodoferax sp.]
MKHNMLPVLVCMLMLWGAQAFAGERILIGAEDDWAPYSASIGGKPQGFAVDIVRAAWAASGLDVELIPLPYARCMKEVERGDLAGCFDTLRDPVLESKYRWHQQPLFQARIGIYGRALGPGDARTPVVLDMLHGKRIGT